MWDPEEQETDEKAYEYPVYEDDRGEEDDTADLPFEQTTGDSDLEAAGDDDEADIGDEVDLLDESTAHEPSVQ